MHHFRLKYRNRVYHLMYPTTMCHSHMTQNFPRLVPASTKASFIKKKLSGPPPWTLAPCASVKTATTNVTQWYVRTWLVATVEKWNYRENAVRFAQIPPCFLKKAIRVFPEVVHLVDDFTRPVADSIPSWYQMVSICARSACVILYCWKCDASDKKMTSSAVKRRRALRFQKITLTSMIQFRQWQMTSLSDQRRLLLSHLKRFWLRVDARICTTPAVRLKMVRNIIHSLHLLESTSVLPVHVRWVLLPWNISCLKGFTEHYLQFFKNSICKGKHWQGTLLFFFVHYT